MLPVIYVDFLLIALVANSAWIMALIVPAFLLLHYGVVLREEKYLEGKLGEGYLSYKKSVRRWV